MSEYIGKFFGALFWGWLADNLGRRPSLLTGLTGCVIIETLIGLRFFVTAHDEFYYSISHYRIAKTTCGPYLECFVEGL